VYQITDNAIPGSTAAATVFITIPSPGGPVARDNAYACVRNTPCAPGNILGNDASLAGGVLTVDSIVKPPTNGTLVWLPTGGFTFNPDK
jgi:hypothetical protein